MAFGHGHPLVTYIKGRVVPTNEAAPEAVRPVIRPCRPSVHPSGRLLHIVKEESSFP